jgi:hypothetical protein
MRNSRDAHTGQKATISAGASWSSGSRPRSAIQPAASSLTHLHSAHRITMAREPTSQDRTRCHPCTRSARWGVGGARGGLAGRGRVPARKPAARRERGTIADFDGVRNMSERLTTCVVTYLDSSAAVRSSPSAVAIRLRRLRLPYEGRLSMSGNRGLGELQCGGSWVSSWCFSSPSYGGRRRSGSRNIERVTV